MGTAPKTPKAPEPPPPGIKVGDVVLDRYRVIEQIASGGHSVVYRGTDERLNRPVCIKVFSGLGGKSGLGRTSYEHFVQEAFALSRLTHPNTLRIFDFGHLGPKDAEGMPLQVCEYMNGGTLSQLIREKGTQPLGETARVVSAMCAALAEAHTLGIVHRDIKPQNILFGSVGVSKLPKLADFGIAKWSADSEDSGQRAEDTAIVAGQKLAMYSPSWAAPEQLAGQPVSPATDIYSLAVVAVYMLSGKAIFADEDVYAGYKKRRHAEEHIRDALGPLNIPKQAIALLTKALAFDPKRRLTRVDDLATGLTAAAESTSESTATQESFEVLTSPLLPTPTVPHAALTPPAGTARAAEIADPMVPQAVSTERAPTPPVIPTTPAPTREYRPPPLARPPWMSTPTSATAGVQLLAMVDTPQRAADRNLHFIHGGAQKQADLIGPQHMRVRITLIPGPRGLVVHLKGLSCFVAHLGGRPSPAVQIDQPSDISLVTPRAEEVGHVRVTPGTPSGDLLMFTLGGERVSVRTEDCADPILFDFGPGNDAYFVYTQGRSIARTRR